MKRAFLLFVLLPLSVFGQTGNFELIVPEKFKPFYDSSYILKGHTDYTTNVFFADTNLKRPRFMAVNRKNVLHVADMNAGQIFAIPDENNDGIGDTLLIASPKVDTAHSLAFWADTMYVAEPSKVRKFVDEDNDGYYEKELPFITGIGSTGPYNHFTRTIIIDSMQKKIYVSVGASCNACRETDPERGTILEFELDGTGRTTFATGLRNALGLAIDEELGTLWAANADRDGLGNDVPEEIIVSVPKGAFFGWPLAYGGGTWIDFNAAPEYQALLPTTAADSVLVSAMRTPEITVEAHTTPMGLIFYRDPRIYIQPPPKTLLIARHGSSKGGRPVGHGYDVLRYQWDPIIARWEGSTFLGGFLTDSVNYKYWGRPCGLVQDSAANIYLTSDVGIKAIYRIALKPVDSVPKKEERLKDILIYPNPNVGDFSLSLASESHIEMYDALGRKVDLSVSLTNVSSIFEYHCRLKGAYATGVYYLYIQRKDSNQVYPVVITK